LAEVPTKNNIHTFIGTVFLPLDAMLCLRPFIRLSVHHQPEYYQNG